MRVGLPGLLFVVFLVLKLCGVIAWSWWWVTCPLWGGFVAVCGIFAMTWVVLIVKYYFVPKRRKFRE